MDANDLTSWEELGEGGEGDAIVGVVEGWDEDDGVGDVEIGVAGWEALAVHDDWTGVWEWDDREWLNGGGLLEAEQIHINFINDFG